MDTNDELLDINAMANDVINDDATDDDATDDDTNNEYDSLMTSELTFTSENMDGVAMTDNNPNAFEGIEDFEFDVNLFESQGKNHN